MSLGEFLKSFFTIKKFPLQHEVLVTEARQRFALGLVIIGIIFLAVAFLATIYKALFFSGLKVEVGEFSFWGLILSLLVAVIAITRVFVQLMNSYSNYLAKCKERKFNVIFKSLASYFFTVYLAFFAINQVYLLGYYSDQAHQGICNGLVDNGKKNGGCLRYEKNTSLIGRTLLYGIISEYI